ncbi:Uncharacterised protein [Sebaldella termitidis]|uniref:Uncharacterized protein n=1 Tax=Sebaldella termitidis (strain ATCC 33386 / NCTC 11300) TaxID=526218 RepID=D1AR65_SEBTE|nr:hypothetical protein [Sebaldella termitidis]ACZ07753.1 hypothetical protein Sterm_0881 [Sebaldella termitidis ATCC 33386]SUI23050.1 Uncharacterised protein [Sebaldella termitidis]
MTAGFIMSLGGLIGFVGFAIWGLVKYVLKDDDITNKEIEEKNQMRHEETQKTFQRMTQAIDNLTDTMQGKYISPQNFSDSVSLKFKELQLLFYSTVEKNNVQQNYDDIMKEIDIRIEEKQNELENNIKLSGNSELSKLILSELKPIFLNYSEKIKDAFFKYRESLLEGEAKKGETKREISNHTQESILKCKEKLETR